MLVLMLLMLAACDNEPESVIAYADLPATGDAARGETLYHQLSNPLCSSCHVDDIAAAPALDTYTVELAESRVADMDAREYTFYSIVEPWRFIPDNYGDAMPNRYDDELSPQDIADLIEYMLSPRPTATEE